MDHAPIIESLVGKLPTHPLATYRKRPLDLIHWIAIHHAASAEDITPEAIARYHVEERGWPGIAYQFLVRPDGLVYKCWPATTATYCVKGHNTKTLCICLLGNRDTGSVPHPQWMAAVELAHLLSLAYAVPIENILGHREFEGAETACPGRFVNMVDFRDAVRTLND